MHLGLVDRLNQALDERRRSSWPAWTQTISQAPNRLERQLAFMTAHPEVGICGSWYMPFNFDGAYLARLPTEHSHIAARTLFDSPFGHPTIMFNMKHLNKHGLRYSKQAEQAQDYDLWERAHPLSRWQTSQNFFCTIGCTPLRSASAKAPVNASLRQNKRCEHCSGSIFRPAQMNSPYIAPTRHGKI